MYASIDVSGKIIAIHDEKGFAELVRIAKEAK